MTVAKESEFTSCWWIRLERDGLVNWYMLNHTSLCFSQLVVGYSKKEFLRRRVSSLRVYKWPLPKTKMRNQFDSNQLLMWTTNLNNHERECNVTEVGSQKDAWPSTANQWSITWKPSWWVSPLFINDDRENIASFVLMNIPSSFSIILIAS